MVFAGSEEDMPSIDGVEAVGNVEEWLGKVEREMQKSVRARCLATENDVQSGQMLNAFRDFCKEYQSQFALLGVQLLWTRKITEALEAKQKDRKAEFIKKKAEIVKIMNELTAMCLEDIKTKLERTKIETLVTIHVHQVGLTTMIQDGVNARKIEGLNDFEWLKNTRFMRD